MKSIGKRNRELSPGYANHPSILKKLAIVGIAAGAAFNTTACSAESEPSQPVAVATTAEDVIPSTALETADKQAEGEQPKAKDKLIPEERQRAREIVLPEVLRRLDYFEGLIATSSNDPIWQDGNGDMLYFQDDRGMVLPRDEVQHTGVRQSDGLTFYLDHELKGTVLEVHDGTDKRCAQSEESRCGYDNSLQGTWLKFSTPKSYLSKTGDLTPEQVREILNDPELQIVRVTNYDGAMGDSVVIDANGALKGYNDLHIKNEDSGSYDITSTADNNPRELLERLINKYRDGLGR